MNTNLDHVRAEMARRRAVMDRTVTDFVTRTRQQAARMPVPADAHHHVDDDANEDYDQVDSWMADPRGGDAPAAPARSTPHDAALDRLDRGELTWGEVLSGRATDPSSVAVRMFVEDRLADVRRVREART